MDEVPIHSEVGWLVDGAGDPGSNGFYGECGSCEGSVLYRKDAEHFLWKSSAFGWVIAPAPGGPRFCYAIPGPPTGRWIVGPQGKPPAPRATYMPRPEGPINFDKDFNYIPDPRRG